MRPRLECVYDPGSAVGSRWSVDGQLPTADSTMSKKTVKNTCMGFISIDRIHLLLI